MVEESECLFCKIVRGEIPSKKVYEDENIFAFLDINPRNPGHTLVIPKRHAETILDMSEEETGTLFQGVRKVAGMVKTATQAQGISIGQSNGKAAGQLIAHAHVHIIPRFMNEGPAALESIIPAKKMDDAVLDEIAKKIAGASSAGPAQIERGSIGETMESAKTESEQKEPETEEETPEAEDLMDFGDD